MLITGAAFGLGNALTLVGLPVLSATLYVARIFAKGERTMVAWIVPVPSARIRYKEPAASAAWWKRIITPLGDGQNWLDLGHGLLVFVTSVAAFAITVTWWAVEIAGTLYPSGDGPPRTTGTTRGSTNCSGCPTPGSPT